MKIESTAFGPTEVRGFLDELIVYDRDRLVERLEAASAELGRLGESIEATTPADDGWSAHEVLAHIVALSKLYGMMTYRVGSGAMTEFDLLSMVNQRDTAAQALLEQPPAELVAIAQADHRRTADYLRRATPEELARQVDCGPLGKMAAADVARLALVAHVEQHIAQLKASLRPS